MHITLPPEAQAIIDREIESGYYAAREEDIVEVLERLDRRHARLQPEAQEIAQSSMSDCDDLQN
jgi:Arc/MetJ-type ribon-helix-helix transcriptional regulator